MPPVGTEKPTKQKHTNAIVAIKNEYLHHQLKISRLLLRMWFADKYKLILKMGTLDLCGLNYLSMLRIYHKTNGARGGGLRTRIFGIVGKKTTCELIVVS